MTISSHFPVVSPAQATATLRALALVPGQTVEGRVLGPGIEGATLVQIGRQAMSLSLPSSLQTGATLTLAVQQSDGQLRLALLGSTPPDRAGQPNLPATSVEISQRPAAPQAPITYAPPSSAPAGLSPGGGAGLVGAGVPVAGLAVPGAAAPAAGAALPGVSGLGGAMAVNPALAVNPATGPMVQRPGLSPYGMGGTNSPLGMTPQAVPAPQGVATTPATALAQMVQQSIPGQGSIGAVMSILVAASGQALPEPVMRAARQILDNQLLAQNGKVDAGALKAAVGKSGIFQEAQLGQGTPASAAGDTKSGLLAMRQGLSQWLGNQAAIAQVSQLPPPLKHVMPRARLPEVLPDEAFEDPEDVGRQLLHRTEGALSRVRLQQHASLPDPAKAGDADWSMDLPLAYGGQQTVLHLQIHGDGGTEASKPEERGWQVRFAVNLPDLGEVGAQVSLRAQNTGILLWADTAETAKIFSAKIDELRESLEAAGLKPGALVVRRGAPGDPFAPAEAGQFLDAKR
jgi:hypothetical protein